MFRELSVEHSAVNTRLSQIKSLISMVSTGYLEKVQLMLIQSDKKEKQ